MQQKNKKLKFKRVRNRVSSVVPTCEFKVNDIVWNRSVSYEVRYYKITKITAKRARAMRLPVQTISETDILPHFPDRTILPSLDVPNRSGVSTQFIQLVREGSGLRKHGQMMTHFNPRDSELLQQLQTGGFESKLSLDEMLTIPTFRSWILQYEGLAK